MIPGGFSGSNWLMTQSTETLSTCQHFIKRSGSCCVLGRRNHCWSRQGMTILSYDYMISPGCQSVG